MSIVYCIASTSLTMFVIFFVYVNTHDEPLTPRKVFVTFLLITLIRANFYEMYNSVLRVSAAVVSMRRIKV